eukprot:14120351-Alexandrium_andersonii.AAC.1
MEDAAAQLRWEGKMPSTSRQTVLGRAALAWHSVNHASVSRGFVAAGIANALDGTEDDQLSAE